MSDFNDWTGRYMTDRPASTERGRMNDAYHAGAAAQIEKDAGIAAREGRRADHTDSSDASAYAAAAAIRAQLKP